MKVGTGKFYEMAYHGEKMDADACVDFINSYQRIIIWGAGNLGNAVGQELIKRGVKIEAYWDLRYDHLAECNHRPVREPMGESVKEDTLIIFCITNAFVIPKLLKEMEARGILYVEGTAVYQALICPVSLTEGSVRECYGRKECNVATCKRMEEVLYQRNIGSDKLFLRTVDVYITQKCSLNCKYCYIYTNSYPLEKKIHFSTQQILEDIDIICDAASFIKRMVPFGGEPFLHPDVAVIVERMAAKENVGVIDLISNGIFRQPDEILERLKLPNVKIDISNYNNAISEELIRIRENNIERLVKLGLNVIAHNETPQWRKPGLLCDNHLTESELKEKKRRCGNFAITATENKMPETVVIKDGRFYPCQHCDTLYQLGICKTEEDSIALSKDMPALELAERIRSLVRKEKYQACRHCNDGIEIVEMAGEQGIAKEYML